MSGSLLLCTGVPQDRQRSMHVKHSSEQQGWQTLGWQNSCFSLMAAQLCPQVKWEIILVPCEKLSIIPEYVSQLHLTFSHKKGRGGWKQDLDGP